MRRKPTEAQKAAAAERKAHMRELARSISAMTPEQRDRLTGGCTVVSIEGRGLSFVNTCMILHQIPGASVVGGFRQWKAAGRYVRKGEHGAAIWIPIAPGRDRAGAGEELPAVADDTPAPAGTVRRTRRFLLGTVFDVSQTVATGAHPVAAPAAETAPARDAAALAKSGWIPVPSTAVTQAEPVTLFA